MLDETKEVCDESPAPQAASSPFGPPGPAEGMEQEEVDSTTVGDEDSTKASVADPLATALLPAPAPTAPIALGPAGDIFVVVNLEATEVEVFAEYHHDFVVAFQVTSAYGHRYGEGLGEVWPRALYRQVVLLGNFAYLQQFLLH